MFNIIINIIVLIFIVLLLKRLKNIKEEINDIFNHTSDVLDNAKEINELTSKVIKTNGELLEWIGEYRKPFYLIEESKYNDSELINKLRSEKFIVIKDYKGDINENS